MKYLNLHSNNFDAELNFADLPENMEIISIYSNKFEFVIPPKVKSIYVDGIEEYKVLKK
jgi:hypothetical protein